MYTFKTYVNFEKDENGDYCLDGHMSNSDGLDVSVSKEGQDLDEMVKDFVEEFKDEVWDQTHILEEEEDEEDKYGCIACNDEEDKVIDIDELLYDYHSLEANNALLKRRLNDLTDQYEELSNKLDRLNRRRAAHKEDYNIDDIFSHFFGW